MNPYTHLRPNNDKSPYELWFGRPASIKQFKVFGSKCYTKNNDEHLGKYDDMADEGIFLGYSTNSKGYTCYNKRVHKLVDYIDIKIDEGIPMNDSQISSIESNTEDTVEIEEEHVQESEKEDSESDDKGANIQVDSRQQTETKPPSIIV